jgi:hypothetical protein
VGAVLGDALRRVAVLGGREGMSRSLGSVYGGAVTRFLGGSLRGIVSRAIDMPFRTVCKWVAVSRDGTTLLLSDSGVPADGHNLYELHAADGSRRRVVGGKGDAPLQFNSPRQVCIAADGFVFVADYHNHRVQVLTPTLDFDSFIGQGQVALPLGVCANADVVVVTFKVVAVHGSTVFAVDMREATVTVFG